MGWSKSGNKFQKLICDGVGICLYSLNVSFFSISNQGHFLCVVCNFMRLTIITCFRFCVWTGRIVFMIIKNKIGMNFPHIGFITCYDSSIVVVKTGYPSRHVSQSYIYIYGWRIVLHIFYGDRFNVGYDSLVSREVFPFSKLFELALRPTHYPVLWVLRAFSLGLMQPNVCLLLRLRMHRPKPPLPYVFMTWCFINHRNSFICLTNLCWGGRGVSVFPVIYSFIHWCLSFNQRYISVWIQLSTKS